MSERTEEELRDLEAGKMTRLSGQIEEILRERFHANGTGLGTLFHDVKVHLPHALHRKFHEIIRVRNDYAHEHTYRHHDFPRIDALCSFVIDELKNIRISATACRFGGPSAVSSSAIHCAGPSAVTLLRESQERYVKKTIAQRLAVVQWPGALLLGFIAGTDAWFRVGIGAALAWGLLATFMGIILLSLEAIQFYVNAIKLILALAVVGIAIWGLSALWGVGKLGPDSPTRPGPDSIVGKREQVHTSASSSSQTKRGNPHRSQNKIDESLGSDIESAKPFVSGVLDKIRCKPDDFWKQNAMFETVSAPGMDVRGWIGPWAGFVFPDGTCMSPVSTYGWAREHGGYFGATLSVQVKWQSSDGAVRKQFIALRNIPDFGWRVTKMEAR